eukprot:9723-Heterococcus_DN1.PRE.1
MADPLEQIRACHAQAAAIVQATVQAKVDEILELRAQLADKDRQLAEKDRQLARNNDVIANYKNHARQIVELGDANQEVDNVELPPSQSAAAQAGSSRFKAAVAEQHTPAKSTHHALHAAAVPATSAAAAPASNDLRPESDITSGAGAAAGTANSAQQQQQHKQQWEQQQQQQQQQQQPPQQQQQQLQQRVLGKGKGRARDTTAAAAASTPVAVQLSDSNISSDTDSDVMLTPRAAKRARTVKDDKAVKHNTDLTVTIAAFRQRLPADIRSLQHLDLGSLIAHKGIDAQGKAKHPSQEEQTALYDSFFDLVNSSINNSSGGGSSSSSRSTKLSLRSLDIDDTFVHSGVFKSAILPKVFATFPELKALSITWCYASSNEPILPIKCKDQAMINSLKQGLAKLTQLRCLTDSIGVVRTVLTDCVSLQGLHLMGV